MFQYNNIISLWNIQNIQIEFNHTSREHRDSITSNRFLSEGHEKRSNTKRSHKECKICFLFTKITAVHDFWCIGIVTVNHKFGSEMIAETHGWYGIVVSITTIRGFRVDWKKKHKISETKRQSSAEARNEQRYEKKNYNNKNNSRTQRIETGVNGDWITGKVYVKRKWGKNC